MGISQAEREIKRVDCEAREEKILEWIAAEKKEIKKIQVSMKSRLQALNEIEKKIKAGYQWQQ
jgi:hypothetical protein